VADSTRPVDLVLTSVLDRRDRGDVPDMTPLTPDEADRLASIKWAYSVHCDGRELERTAEAEGDREIAAAAFRLRNMLILRAGLALTPETFEAFDAAEEEDRAFARLLERNEASQPQQPVPHTTGTLQVVRQPDGFGGEDVHLFAVRGARFVFATVGHIDEDEVRAHEEVIADAERLAACWNACDGIPTAALALPTVGGAYGRVVELRFVSYLLLQLMDLLAEHTDAEGATAAFFGGRPGAFARVTAEAAKVVHSWRPLAEPVNEADASATEVHS
jgi:hypothetical protein